MSVYFYLLIAIAFLCLAHYVRILRWELFIKIYEEPDRASLLSSLSIGYIVNYIVPYKAGDIVRAFLAGGKMKNGRVLRFSTVLVDRILDVICVGFIFLCLYLTGAGIARENVIFYLGFTVILIAIILAVYIFRSKIKTVILKFADIFNRKIENFLLYFAWALICNFKDMIKKISKIKIFLATCGMWVSYLASYYMFSIFAGNFEKDISWTDVFVLLFSQNSVKLGTGEVSSIFDLRIPGIYMFIYMVIPLVILILISFFIGKYSKSSGGKQTGLSLLPHFNPEDRLLFLENYFSENGAENIENYLQINRNITIIRDYSAGSKAVTLLCLDGEEMFFRKIAFGDSEAEKLRQQIDWIKQNSRYIPLPAVLREEKNEMYCWYDMPYVTNSVSFFEYIHSTPPRNTWEMLHSLLEQMENSVYSLNVRNASRRTVNEYIKSKVIKNLEKIKSSKNIQRLLKYGTLYINGTEYKNLNFFEKYLDGKYLQKIFEKDVYSTIHGDLTVENIVCTRDPAGRDSYYLIDPNTGNIHDCPNLDYGKLLQSLHGGYEFLMSVNEVSVNENRIDFLFIKSSAYSQLYNLFKNYLTEKFTHDRVRSIFFHEIIHWLRLMPYKIEKNDDTAVAFYAGMLMVMSDIISMYGDDEVFKN